MILAEGVFSGSGKLTALAFRATWSPNRECRTALQFRGGELKMSSCLGSACGLGRSRCRLHCNSVACVRQRLL